MNEEQFQALVKAQEDRHRVVLDHLTRLEDSLNRLRDAVSALQRQPSPED